MTVEQIIKTVPAAFVWALRLAGILAIALLIIAVGMIATKGKGRGE